MKRVLVVLVILITVNGCDNSYNTKGNSGFSTFSKICVDNIYYLNSTKKLSVLINPKTLKPQNCK